MFRKVMSATIIGVNCIPIQVEADVRNGLPGIFYGGLFILQSAGSTGQSLYSSQKFRFFFSRKTHHR